jgi:hypothetical protein
VKGSYLPQFFILYFLVPMSESGLFNFFFLNKIISLSPHLSILPQLKGVEKRLIGRLQAEIALTDWVPTYANKNKEKKNLNANDNMKLKLYQLEATN